MSQPGAKKEPTSYRNRQVAEQYDSSSSSEEETENRESKKIEHEGDKPRIKRIKHKMDDAEGDVSYGKPLDFHPDIKYFFNKCMKPRTITKNSNSALKDLIFCFPLDWYINRKNAKRCEEWTFKMEVLGQKIALHGTDYFHVDRAQRNEYSLYRADGELTDQPAMCRHEADEGTKIYKNDRKGWVETDDKVNGIRFIRKCTLTSELKVKVPNLRCGPRRIFEQICNPDQGPNSRVSDY